MGPQAEIMSDRKTPDIEDPVPLVEVPAEPEESEKKENETGQEIAKDDSETGWIAVAKSKPRWVQLLVLAGIVSVLVVVIVVPCVLLLGGDDEDEIEGPSGDGEGSGEGSASGFEAFDRLFDDDDFEDDSF